MIKLIEFVFRLIVACTFGVLAVASLCLCSLLLWKLRYFQMAEEISDILLTMKSKS